MNIDNSEEIATTRREIDDIYTYLYFLALITIKSKNMNNQILPEW